MVISKLSRKFMRKEDINKRKNILKENIYEIRRK